jgi:hypothetical protein
MDSQADDIKTLFGRFKGYIPWRVFYWTLGIMMSLILIIAGWTRYIDKEVEALTIEMNSKILTEDDMQKFADQIIQAVKK